MLPSLSVQKVSEQYRDYIITSGFIVAFNNYLEFLKVKNDRRKCIVKVIQISDDIAGKLRIYPTGISKQFDEHISIYVEAQWKKSKTMALKFDTAILDNCGKRKHLNSSENFTKVSFNKSIGDPQVVHANFCEKNCLRFLNGGCLSILVNISVHIGMMIHPEMLDRFQEEFEELERKVKKLIGNPSYGDAVLTVRDKRFYVKRKVLVDGNPMFARLFSEKGEAGGRYSLDQSPEVIMHIVLDCYLNGEDDDEQLKNK